MMRQDHIKKILPVFGLVLLTGCATKLYQEPTSQDFLDAQRAVTRAIERNIRIEPGDVKCIKLEVEVHADGGLGGKWGLERYLSRYVEETVIREGGLISAEGERRLVIFVTSAGTSAIGRRLSLPTGQGFSIPLWYSETSEGNADFLIVYQDKDRRILKAQINNQTADIRDIFLFYSLHVPDEIINKPH
jgi:hypothetical protein